MGNPFYNFTLASTGAPVYIDITTIESFYRYIDPKIDDGEVECTIISTANESNWAVEEEPDLIFDYISNFIDAEKLGYTP